jgi:hypothetical protein
MVVAVPLPLGTFRQHFVSGGEVRTEVYSYTSGPRDDAMPDMSFVGVLERHGHENRGDADV